MGGGSAGASTAIALAKSGAVVLLVERRAGCRVTFGESLPPSVRPLLHQLGIWDAFLATEPRPCYGNRSAWGGDGRVVAYDFILDRNGHGWHIDRGSFEAMLQAAAVRAGAGLLRGTRIDEIDRDAGGQWRVQLSGPGGQSVAAASFVVDASGRAATFGRRQGSRRQRFDRLVASTAFLDRAGGRSCEGVTLVEAVPEGWWYSAPVPDGRLAVAFFTDADLEAARLARTENGWWSLLSASRSTRERIEECGTRLTETPRIVAAGSSVLGRVTGDGWLAVGDAAATHDPLSSHGIGAALDGGLRAASAVLAHLDGDVDMLTRYAAQLFEAYARYLLLWRSSYAEERRWPDAPFWRRRHNVAQSRVFTPATIDG